MWDTIIIGGGAAGLFCAANLKDQRVLLLEGNAIMGSKMLLSGSGRCNLSNSDKSDVFLSHFGKTQKAAFLQPSLKNMSTTDLKDWFESRGLSIITREDGKRFPADQKAESVVNLLRREAERRGVSFKHSLKVKNIEKKEGSFKIETQGESFFCQRVVLTCGGMSFPGTGSDGSGYRLARNLGHSIIEPTQALVGVYIQDAPFRSLSGSSIASVQVDFFRAGEEKRYLQATGDLLFTHQGISGPVILNNSRYLQKNDRLHCSLIKTSNKEESRQHLDKQLRSSKNISINGFLKSLGLFTALRELLLQELSIKGEQKLSQLTKKERKALIRYLLDYPLVVSKKGSFASAMATAGGINLKEVNRLTMESRKIPGLYLAGEIMDIDGDTGGYNIQAAFSTAYLAACQLNKNVSDR